MKYKFELITLIKLICQINYHIYYLGHRSSLLTVIFTCSVTLLLVVALKTADHSRPDGKTCSYSSVLLVVALLFTGVHIYIKNESDLVM